MKTIGTVFILLLFCACSPYKFAVNDFQGTYVQKGNSNVKLNFTNDSFSFIDSNKEELSLYTCCDTITYGSWGLDNSRGLLYLNSPVNLSLFTLDAQISEKKNNSDSLIFIIDNPIETSYLKHKPKMRDIYYKMAITDKNGLFTNDISSIDYDSNIIKMKKPKGLIFRFLN